MSILTVIVGILIIAALAYVAFWLIKAGETPDPFAFILRMAVVVIGLYALYVLFTTGSLFGLALPK